MTIKHYMPKIATIVSASLIFIMVCSCKSAPTTSTITDLNSINSATLISANGLSLFLSLDSTTYQPGQQVTIVIDETNTLSKTNNVPSSDQWPFSGLSVSPCGTNGFPFGVAIFQGDYTYTDISNATPLVIYDPSKLYPCPFVPAITAYDFVPFSDLAAENIDNEPATFAMNQSVTTTYYWTGSAKNVTQHNFEPGIYSVVAGDEWGNMVVLHFMVS